MKTYARLATARKHVKEGETVFAIVNGGETLYIVMKEDQFASIDRLEKSAHGGWTITGWMTLSRLEGNLNARLPDPVFVTPVTIVKKPIVDGFGYANKWVGSDCDPYEIVEVLSDRKIVVRAMASSPDPSFVMQWNPGGFAAHLANNQDQKWLIESVETGALVTLTKRRDGKWKAEGTDVEFVLASMPQKFYDWNF